MTFTAYSYKFGHLEIENIYPGEADGTRKGALEIMAMRNGTIGKLIALLPRASVRVL